MPKLDLRRPRLYVNQSRLHVALSHLCGLIVGVSYVGWIVLLVFCIDLLLHRGHIRITDESESAIVGTLLSEADRSRLGLKTNEVPVGTELSNAGILPSVVRLRDKWYAPTLKAIYRGVPSSHTNLGTLQALIGTSLIIAVIRFLLLMLQSRLLTAATIGAQARLQREIFDKQFSFGTIGVDAATRDRLEPLLRDRLPAMLRGVQTYMERGVREFSKIGSLVVLCLLMNVPLTLVFLTMAALAWVVGWRVFDQFVRRGRSLGATRERMTNRLLGLAGKHRLITGYNADEYYQKQFQRYVRQASNATADRLRFRGRLVPLRQFAGLVMFITILGLGAHNVLTNRFELSAAIGLFAALASIALPVSNLLDVRSIIQRGSDAAAEIFAFLDHPTPPAPKQGSQFMSPLSKGIEFDHVRYTDYEGTTILKDVSLTIPQGRRVGIIAKSDLERRAFIYLIARLIEPTEGKVRFDGVDIRKGTLESLRAQVAVVLQSDLLFPDSVAGNIGCGDPSFSLPQITEAAKVAHAHHFIQKLPHGYECVIGDQGFPIKAGEAYRIALARAIIRDPAVVCIEEPQDRMDADTKALIDDTMNRFKTNRTMIVLPTRLSTVRSCDEIVLLNDGEIEAIGTHRSLLQSSELYRHLQYVEFSASHHA